MEMLRQDWERLRALRDRFLTDATGNYWRDARDLELYDAVFAQRIGWKWDGVLASLDRAGWKPAAAQILDWGCGTGIASRAVSAWSGIASVALFDESPMAAAFAAGKFGPPGAAVRSRPFAGGLEPGTLLLISHVAGELDDGGLLELAALAASADEVIWVEPGSRDLSRRLGAVRETLLRGGHRIIAPCTHLRPCPMIEPRNAQHWCHFFARPPIGIFQSNFWREVSMRLEIDLRSLPYSFLASSRRWSREWPGGAERLIGHPREFKAHCKLLCCGATGLEERTLQRRDDPDLFRRIVKKGADGVFAWGLSQTKSGQVNSGRLVDGD
ncbi:MAG: small ribosomal subunit Rsm22 family protein [Terrimicrobiaceae bacterium]|nr:small ribosomal subunit Rsm22 family protein [Terrimicrobiaceae bacterium]